MTKYIERAMKRFPEILNLNQGNVAMTCRKMKISRTAYINLYTKDKEFARRCDDIQERLLDDAESVLHRQIHDGNTAALIFFLKTKGKSRGYIERTETDNRNIEEVRIVVKE